MLGVRVTVLQDLDSLNKAELLSIDEWQELMSKPEAALTPDEIGWLDRAAELTMTVDERFEEMRAFYAASAYGRAVGRGSRRLAWFPIRTVNRRDDGKEGGKKGKIAIQKCQFT